MKNVVSALALMLATLVGGCGRPAVDTAPIVSAAVTTAAAPGETWEALYIQGAKVGYTHTVTRPDSDDNQLLRIDADSRLSVERFGQRSEQRFQLASWETTDGRLVRFTAEIWQGAKPMRVEGSVQGKKLALTTIQGDRRQVSEIVLPGDVHGFLAVEQTLRAKPMQPGEHRNVTMLMPIVNLPVICELSGNDYETTKLLSGESSLLRIEQVAAVPGSPRPLQTTLWCDRSGEVLKSHVTFAGQESYRTTREEAENLTGSGKFDLGNFSSVTTNRSPRDPHSAMQVRYRVTVAGQDPQQVFVTGPSQQVNSIDATTAAIIVRAVRPESGPVGPSADTGPTDGDRQPSPMIQSDDANIIALSKEVGPGDDWQVATNLEHLVRSKVTNKNLSQTFASAAETLASGEGDCTEHAVLLAALCRARGIPARVAMGLVYVERIPGFAFHMWTEAYIGDKWIGLDGTLGRGGLGGGHLKLGHTSLESHSALASLLPIVQVLGKLKIEFVDVN